ncbi:MAG: hypothetical protein JW969_04300 [Spirochaetales bacterium]|nr:hypothetical protein [Spirochaetales bacterium]
MLEKGGLFADKRTMKKFLICAVFLACFFQLFPLDITINNDYSEWKKVFNLASFSPSYNPVYFNEEKNGVITTLTIDKAQYWAWGGTLLKEFKAVYKGDSICFYISTQNRMARGLIFYFYLYKDRNKGNENTYTLEIPFTDYTEKKILLWEYGEKATRSAGIFISNGTKLEGRIDINALPPDMADNLTERYSFDLTTCYYEKSTGTYEEFFFTTVYFKDIPKENEL